jgi:hypothetical protein
MVCRDSEAVTATRRAACRRSLLVTAASWSSFALTRALVLRFGVDRAGKRRLASGKLCVPANVDLVLFAIMQ